MARLEETIRQSSPGDPLLYEALMVDYYNFIYRLTNSILGDQGEAEDAAQETFIKAATHLGDYQIGTKIKSWLAKIAINLCRDKLRKLKTRRRLQDVLKFLSWQTIQGSPTPEEVVIGNERHKIIQTVIEGLDEKHRLPILLRYGQGMAISEIAEVLDVNEGTVHSRLHYAHLKLRDRLNGFAHEQDDLAKEGLE
jgi:RNA polymerase sigma-70 factor (ECF subfamily)